MWPTVPPRMFFRVRPVDCLGTARVELRVKRRWFGSRLVLRAYAFPDMHDTAESAVEAAAVWLVRAWARRRHVRTVARNIDALAGDYRPDAGFPSGVR